ncbi:MAG: hypothetical protein D3921_12540 [Candidatus Electrothrix sp. AW1]|nr:hypothetical protein [Candidatus Electrothrix sp. AX1]MCI5183317.1 hypothetical protein [Candidatus Electrothrix gigas]
MMLCPKCKNNHKKNDGTYCRCGYRFVFRPDVDSGMTDNKFLSLVRKASADNRYYFTFSQLYTVWCKAEDNMSLGSLMIIYIVFGFIGLLLLFPSMKSDSLWLLLLLFTIFLIHAMVRWNCISPNRKEFRRLVTKWSRSRCSYVEGTLDKMLEKPSLYEPPPEFSERDLYDYGVERIIIVERKILVDLLVKNGFHTEQRALIFSMNGYPSYIAERAKILLKSVPELPIYLLHDATHAGVSMRRKIILHGQENRTVAPKPSNRTSSWRGNKKIEKLSGMFCGEIAGMKHFDVLHKSTEDGLTTLQKKISPHIPNILDLGVFPEQLQDMPGLKPLRLEEQEYQAPLDIIPYASLASLIAAAIAANLPFDEVLESRKEDDNYG